MLPKLQTNEGGAHSEEARAHRNVSDFQQDDRSGF
jgi:hypothetical protein